MSTLYYFLGGVLMVAPICLTLRILGVSGWEYWLLAGVSGMTTWIFYNFVPRELK